MAKVTRKAGCPASLASLAIVRWSDVKHTSLKGYIMVALRSLRRSHPLLAQGLSLPLDAPNLSQSLGLDWTADLTPVYVMDADANPRPIPGKMGLVRSDSGSPLSVVGSRFVPFQNAQALDFFRQVADPDARIVSGKSFNGGQHVAITAEVPALTASFGQDTSKGYLTISNRHGSGSLSVDLWTLRLVCSNGATIKVSLDRGISRGRHTSGLIAKVSDLADAYKEAVGMWAGATAQFRAMVEKPSFYMGNGANSGSLQRITLAAFGLTLDDIADETERSATIRGKKEATIRRIRNSDTCKVPGTAGTVYADLQAVTEFVNHERGDDDGESTMFGNGADMIERATAEAFAIATD